MTQPTPAGLLAAGLISRSEHLAGVEAMTMSPDAGGGGLLRVRVFDGFEVDVLPDRGLDIGAVWYRGRPLSWISPVSDRSRVANMSGTEWLTRFNGGLVTTCGLENVGPARDGYGLHGGHSHQPAGRVSWDSQVTESGTRVTISGVVDSVELFGRRVYVYRTITVGVDEGTGPYVEVADLVRNEGVQPAPAALLYHVNLGAPAIVPGTTIHVAADGATPREAREEVPTADRLPAPSDVMMEAVFEYHGLQTNPDGMTPARVSTPGLGYDIEVSWSADTLPRLAQWVFPTKGGWALGLEPGNAAMFGPDHALAHGGAPVLGPGEEFCAGVRVAAVL